MKTSHATLLTPDRAIRAAILHCIDAPGNGAVEDQVQYFEDGMLLVERGRVSEVGEAGRLLPRLDSSVPVDDQRGYLLVPGFVDTHVHYPQTDIIAAHGKRLLEWLENYAWPAEAAFAEPEVCAATAEFFISELLRNGTTTACVFGSVHMESVDQLMQVARRLRLRLIAGKVLMDRNCPEAMREPWQAGIESSAELIARWHGQERLAYALTPRFAPTCSPKQLAATGQLLDSRPGLYLQSHMAETLAECRWVAELFPQAPSYLHVYDDAGLVGERSIFAHCIHIDDRDRSGLAAAGAAIAFCPTSNLFLGSGLFDYRAARDAKVRVGLGTDIGAGTRFGIPATAGEAYKVAKLSGQVLDPLEAFYLATLGGARALRLDGEIGNFAAGKEADCVLLDYNATPLLARRTASTDDLAERLFALMMLGDDRSVAATYVLGEKVYVRS